MTFNSYSYFLFLPVIYLVFYATSDRWRWLVLLVASYVFYATFNAFYLLAVLIMVTGISYTCGLRIAAQVEESIRKKWFWGGCSVCVAILILMKYFPYLVSKTNDIPGLNSTFTPTIITIGVSYFTFQAISYLADIYLEIEEPEPHFGRFALYMAFFPKLLQGPIERAGDFLPQLRRPYLFDYDAIRSGMLLFSWGLFKKVVVADRLSVYADQVYNNVHSYSGVSLILGTYVYALQVFFDFSAYTDMARGTGRLFGFNLSINFNNPYLSASIADFWRRWHISFSRWILDYIFKPLQMAGRNWGRAGTAFALLITFLISGVWHGATWGFVIWGLLHGIYLAASIYYQPYQKRLHKWLKIEKKSWLRWWQVFVTFNLVSFAWIFFRANNLSDSWYVVSHLFKGVAGEVIFSQGKVELAVIVIILPAYFFITQYLFKNTTIHNFYSRSSLYRFTTYNVLLITMILLAKYSAGKKFIYFQF